MANTWEEKYGKPGKTKKKGKGAVIAIIIAVIVIAIVASVVVGFRRLMNKTADALGSEAVVESYEKRDMSTYINATGTVESSEIEDITTDLQYPVKEIRVALGDRVKAGDVVAVIDTKDIDERIEALEAQSSDEERRTAKELEIANRQLAQTKQSTGRSVSRAANEVTKAAEDKSQAEESLEKARKAYKKAKKKAETASATDAAMVTSETLKGEYEAAKLELEQREAAYDAAVDAYNQVVDGQKETIDAAVNSNELTQSSVSSYSALAEELARYYEMKESSVIIAETSGIVTSVNATEGLPASGTVLRIKDDTKLEITVNVKESDIFKLKEGQSVEISSSTLEQVQGSGTVSKIYRFADTVSGETMLGVSQAAASTYTVVISVDSYENLLIGMGVKVKISTGNELSVMAVPYTAILEEDGDSSVYVAVDSGMNDLYMVQRKSITVGETGDYYTEVTGGDLKEGDKVICYPDTVMEGGMTRIKE